MFFLTEGELKSPEKIIESHEKSTIILVVRKEVISILSHREVIYNLSVIGSIPLLHISYNNTDSSIIIGAPSWKLFDRKNRLYIYLVTEENFIEPSLVSEIELDKFNQGILKTYSTLNESFQEDLFFIQEKSVMDYILDKVKIDKVSFKEAIGEAENETLVKFEVGSSEDYSPPQTSPGLFDKAKKLKNYLVNIRRTIHSYPEPGFEENKTSLLIKEELNKLGIPFETIAKTGVVALIEGSSDGPAIAIRADMDALTVQEENEVPYKSTRPGIMHACGHDGHVAMLLGVAALLVEEEFSGNIKLIFQPAEEGPGGAKVMIEEGVLKNPDVKAIIATHISTGIESGKIGIPYGRSHASADDIKISLFGKGGHAAYPHKGKDTIVMASEVITELQRIISRQRDPFEPVVLTIGTINGGTRSNIIASRVDMTGTVRCVKEETRDLMSHMIKNVLEGVTKSWEGSFEFEYEKLYPPLICDKRVAKVVELVAQKILGDENVLTDYPPTMGGEDFAFFAREIPACMFRLGAGGPDYIYTSHHPKFDFNEEALVTGSVLLAETALRLLEFEL